MKYKTTIFTYSGWSSGATVANGVEQHLNLIASQGYRLVSSCQNELIWPESWFFIWESIESSESDRQHLAAR